MFMCFVCGFAHLASRIAEWHRAALSVACVGRGRDVGLVCHVTPRPLCRQAPLRTKSSNFDRLHLVFHERGRVWQAGTPPCDLTDASSVLPSDVASTASASTGTYAETSGTLVERTRHKFLVVPSSSGAAGSVPVSIPTWCPCSRPDDPRKVHDTTSYPTTVTLRACARSPACTRRPLSLQATYWGGRRSEVGRMRRPVSAA